MTASTTPGALPPLMSTSDIMALLGRSRQTICAWARRGLIPAIKMPDGNYMYSRASIEQWIAERSKL
jgi:predicted site-specific integrase-resolvase